MRVLDLHGLLSSFLKRTPAIVRHPVSIQTYGNAFAKKLNQRLPCPRATKNITASLPSAREEHFGSVYTASAAVSATFATAAAVLIL